MYCSSYEDVFILNDEAVWASTSAGTVFIIFGISLYLLRKRGACASDALEFTNPSCWKYWLLLMTLVVCVGVSCVAWRLMDKGGEAPYYVGSSGHGHYVISNIWNHRTEEILCGLPHVWNLLYAAVILQVIYATYFIVRLIREMNEYGHCTCAIGQRGSAESDSGTPYARLFQE